MASSSSSLSVTAPPPQVKLVCSHGGRIVLHPRLKKHIYIGGITKVVKIDRHISFPAIISLLSTLFSLADGCVLKYQLPGAGLASLISVSNDDDLENMMEEYDNSSPSGSETPPRRFRLFLDAITNTGGPVAATDPTQSEIGGAEAEKLQRLEIADDDKKKNAQESASDGATALVYLGEYVVPRARDLPLPVALPEIVTTAGTSSSVAPTLTPAKAQAAKLAYDRGVQVAYDSNGRPIYYRAPLNAL